MEKSGSYREYESDSSSIKLMKEDRIDEIDTAEILRDELVDFTEGLIRYPTYTPLGKRPNNETFIKRMERIEDHVYDTKVIK
jgi:hypothetical protein